MNRTRFVSPLNELRINWKRVLQLTAFLRSRGMTFDLSVTFVRPWRFAPSLTLEAMSFVMSPRAATFSTKPPTLGHNSIAIYQVTFH